MLFWHAWADSQYALSQLWGEESACLDHNLKGEKVADVDPASESHIFDAIKYALAADRSPHVRFSRRQVW